jgi:DNA repair exonuclease SbcCD ATPase subunit
MFDFNKIKSSFIEFNEDEKKYYSEVVLIKDKNNNSTFSNGENAHLLLQNVLSNEKADFFILDEPSMFLSRESITKFLLPKISELSSENKKIIIATHNSSIGINTIPINYIYRKYKNNNDECETYVGSI